MTRNLFEVAAVADRDGWTAHVHGRPELRDLHWRYRDLILYNARGGHDMTDSIEHPDVDLDVLYAETGDPEPGEVGIGTDNGDDDEEGDTDAD